MADEIWSIPGVLRYRSEHQPEVNAFSFYDKDGLVAYLNFREIYTLAGKFARCLNDWGFHPGDVIANALPNSPERVVTDFGIMMAGCASSNCQVVEKDGSDFWNTAKLSKSRAIILSPRDHDPMYKLFSSCLPTGNPCHGIHDINVPHAPNIERALMVSRLKEDDDADYCQKSFLANLRQSDKEIFQAECAPSSLAILFATSGSSGFSKLIPETHERLLHSGRLFRAAASSVYYIDRPMGWAGGFPYDVLCHGTRRVGQDQLHHNHTEAPAALWSIISRAACTGAALLPGVLCELIDHFQKHPPEHKLQFITSSGQAMKRELMEAIGLLGHALVVSYGSTEGGIFACEAVTSASQFKDFYAGKVMPDVELKIVDEEGNALEHGEEGEIYIKCKRLVTEYYNQPDANLSRKNIYTPDGWFKTGDRGVLHSDKSLFCYGRTGDVVSVGPIVVYLSWPETILNKCPDIQNSSVVGLDGLDGAPELVACVVPKVESAADLTETRVTEFFDGAMVSSSDKSVDLKLAHVFIMDKLPSLPSGKVNKRELKKIVIEKLKVLKQ